MIALPPPPPLLLCQGGSIKSTCFRAHVNNHLALCNVIKAHFVLLSVSVDYTLSSRRSLRNVLPPQSRYCVLSSDMKELCS